MIVSLLISCTSLSNKKPCSQVLAFCKFYLTQHIIDNLANFPTGASNYLECNKSWNLAHEADPDILPEIVLKIGVVEKPGTSVKILHCSKDTSNVDCNHFGFRPPSLVAEELTSWQNLGAAAETSSESQLDHARSSWSIAGCSPDLASNLADKSLSTPLVFLNEDPLSSRILNVGTAEMPRLIKVRGYSISCIDKPLRLSLKATSSKNGQGQNQGRSQQSSQSSEQPD
ncbi:hypothetical protein PoB_001742900 [Plakobranchus ocellatus]|uniref:Uncharacterized protein n=1 Tax=Plakobranchus ocellatus TaxID=259542 RepID=A0AAV3ZAG3_9GAST|nr:hypothetical protein PoB_001742900 [Plakobranchus ocellatus]